MKKRLLVMGVAAILVTAAAAAFWLTPKPVTSSSFAMGSILTTTYWGHDPAWKVKQAIERLEQKLLEATEAPALALEIMEASNGAYSPYLGALVKLWDINGTPRVPTQEEINQALQKKELDFGAYGKGAACDMALKISYVSAVLNLGGNIMTCGQKPWWQPFKIALRDPKGGPNEIMGTFTLKGTYFISTSGSYEKFFEQDGKRYHHIFDPETGYPAQREPGLISVTVVTSAGEAPGALGDMISTACFVLGYEESQDLLAQYACNALFVYEDGTVRQAGDVEDFFMLDTSKYRWSKA